MRTRAITAAIAALALAVALVAASAGSPASAKSAARCVPSPILHGAPPRWTDPAWANSPGFRLPYALSANHAAAAFLWVKLRAGAPANPANKVLWVVRYARQGHPLRILAHWGRDPSVVRRASWSADASPGEIYPSYLNLPRAGCWKLSLSWGSHTAAVNVQIAPSETP
jgi:hypothetical protein